MTGKWNETMKRRGEILGRAQLGRVVDQLKADLSQDLPDHVGVRQDGDDLIVTGPDLQSGRLENSSLRDIGFLMQGVR